MYTMKSPCPHAHCQEVFELRTEREPSQFDVTMFEIEVLLHRMRCAFRKPVLVIRLAPREKMGSRLMLALAFVLLTAGVGHAQESPIAVTVEYAAAEAPAVNPWKMMEEKERADKAEIERLRAQISELTPKPVQPTPYKSVLIPTFTHPELIQEVMPPKREELVGPSLGIRGAKKKIKSYSGTTRETWSFMPPTVRYE